MQMKLPEKLAAVFRVPKLTWTRIVIALTVAVFADGLQFLLGPAGWAFPDQIIDVIAMVLTSRLIGFHWLLLPTFVINFIPAMDDLPSWVVCVIAVVTLRRREQCPAPPPSPPDKPTIGI